MARLVRLRNVALKATCEQRTRRLIFPCAGLLLLCATKKIIEKLTLQAATTIKGKKNLKFIFYGSFTLNPLLQFYRQLFLSLLFVAQKVTKRHSAEKNQLLAPRLTNFRKRKYCLRRTSAALAYNCKQACILLAGTNFASFVVRLPSPFLCKSRDAQVWPRFCGASENLHLFPAPLCSRCL